jgi:hypothetical protein
MNIEIKELMIQAQESRVMYQLGKITRDEAKELIMPYINKVNEKSIELAKKYNQKPKKVSFNSFVR